MQNKLNWLLGAFKLEGKIQVLICLLLTKLCRQACKLIIKEIRLVIAKKCVDLKTLQNFLKKNQQKKAQINLRLFYSMLFVRIL